MTSDDEAEANRMADELNREMLKLADRLGMVDWYAGGTTMLGGDVSEVQVGSDRKELSNRARYLHLAGLMLENLFDMMTEMHKRRKEGEQNDSA